MTNNSYICNFINENPYDWQEKLSKYPYFLKIKEDDGLYIFNYDMLAFEVLEEATEEKEAVIARTNFNLPIVQEARGIIINPENKEVVCWPFRKFGNFGESYVDNIDWKSASVQTKVDGSIMKIWFDKRPDKKKWRVSTNSMIEAHQAKNGFANYGELFDQAAFGELDYSRLNIDNTYIFELVSPKTKIVIEYPETKIYHLGTRSNITGQEYDLDIGIEKPGRFHLDSLSDCIKAAEALNKECNDENRFDVQFEGFVVCDKNFNRIKVKSPEYLMCHHALNNGVLSKSRTLELVENNEIEEYLTYFPQYKEELYDYQKQYFKVINNIDKYSKYANKLFLKVNKNQKEFAEIIKKDRYSWVGFRCVKSNKTAEELFGELSIASKLELIETVDSFEDKNPTFFKFQEEITR